MLTCSKSLLILLIDTYTLLFDYCAKQDHLHSRADTINQKKVEIVSPMFTSSLASRVSASWERRCAASPSKPFLFSLYNERCAMLCDCLRRLRLPDSRRVQSMRRCVWRATEFSRSSLLSRSWTSARLGAGYRLGTALDAMLAEGGFGLVFRI